MAQTIHNTTAAMPTGTLAPTVRMLRRMFKPPIPGTGKAPSME